MEINKDLIAASSTPIVLAILSEGDSYGYAILQRVRELSGGRMEWTDGMLYPVLHRLERFGFVEARWEKAETGRKRKYYQITPRGRDQLAEERKQWQAVDETLRGIWRRMALPPADALVPLHPVHGAPAHPPVHPRRFVLAPRRSTSAHARPFFLPATMPAVFRTPLLQAA